MMKQRGMILLSYCLILSLIASYLFSHLERVRMSHKENKLLIKAQEQYFNSLLKLKNLPHLKLEESCDYRFVLQTRAAWLTAIHDCESSTQNNFLREKLTESRFRGTVFRRLSPHAFWTANLYWRAEGEQIHILGWYEKTVRV